MVVCVFITKSCGPNVKSSDQISLFSATRYQMFFIKIRISEPSPVKDISHIVDLEKLFPDNPLLKDDHIEL